ncbi:hypothetical protein [Nesterenkonia muleiensis]|uniref:hypothetical protein n=1 Tax=Nesterenkonia muleiensis TaxID=2282648 RepID=UPI000E7315D2|nr:hypothetical protein [Nesterenkonia muleiensis]
MMNFYLNLKNALEQRKEEGQGTVEYVGIAVVITVIIAGVVMVLTESQIYEEINSVISRVISSIAEGISG